MNDFVFTTPVTIRMGRGCIKKNRELFTSLGHRALIITGRFAENCRNIALEDVEEVLSQTGIKYSVYEDVEENPSVESVSAVADEIQAFSPDYIVAVGGGSALDTAKAANVLIRYPRSSDAERVFFGGTPVEHGSGSQGLLPMIGVPTTAGSGSEVAGYAILTRHSLGTKQRMDQISLFNYAFLDAGYISESPQRLLDAGAMDALAHGAESWFNPSTNPMNQMLADAGFKLFSAFKDHLLEQRLEGDDFDNMLLAASLQGMAVVQSRTTLPHGMGYALTHDFGLTHGLASVATLGEYLLAFRQKENTETAAEIAHKCGFGNTEELAEFAAKIVARNFETVIPEEDIKKMALDFSKNKGRLNRNPEKADYEDILGIYTRSFKRIYDAKNN